MQVRGEGASSAGGIGSSAPRARTRERGVYRGFPATGRAGARLDRCAIVIGRVCGGTLCRARRPPLRRSVSAAGCVRVLDAPGATGWSHRDAIDRAGRDAQFASGAQRGKHRMHALGGADDCVDGTRVDAQRAADAPGFVDAGDCKGRRRAERWIERGRGPSGQRGKRADDRLATGRTAVDRLPPCNRFGVGSAGVVAAPPALLLRQDGVDANGERGACGHGVSL